MANQLVAPVADPVIDTVHEFENQVVGAVEGFVGDANIKPMTDSAFSLARNIFDIQRDLSRKIVDTVDQTINTVTTTVEGVIPNAGGNTPTTTKATKSSTSKSA